jgi:hypothetical protein
MWRNVRILILLLILLFVALNTYFDRLYTTDWDIPLRVTVFPINGDGSATSESFVQKLNPADLLALEDFFQSESREYGMHMDRPVRFALASPMRELPPMIEPGASRLTVVLWSLRTRYWAWRAPVHPAGPKPDIELFVLFHDPKLVSRLPHSIGLQKGLFGIVHAFADRGMMGSNDVVAAHEFLHTLGATDKYDLATDQPILPVGYAEPDRQPLYPQSFAEIMGGKIPVSPTQAEMPESLRQVIIGPATAVEIGWKK